MEVNDGELICMCNVSQQGNLQSLRTWSVPFPLLGKPPLVRRRPAPLPSRRSSRVTDFNNRFLNLLAWVGCPFFEETAFSRSQDAPGGRRYPHPRAEAWEPHSRSWESPARSSHLWELSPPPFFHSLHYTAFVTLLGDCRLLENEDNVFYL